MQGLAASSSQASQPASELVSSSARTCFDEMLENEREFCGEWVAQGLASRIYFVARTAELLDPMLSLKLDGRGCKKCTDLRFSITATPAQPVPQALVGSGPTACL